MRYFSVLGEHAEPVSGVDNAHEDLAIPEDLGGLFLLRTINIIYK